VQQSDAVRQWSRAGPSTRGGDAAPPALAYGGPAWCEQSPLGGREECAPNLRLANRAALVFVDQQLEQLLGGLARLRLSERTMVVLHADHGFSLGENGAWAKQSAFDAATHVPLLMRIPWLAGRRERVEGVVGLLAGETEVAAPRLAPRHHP